MTATDHPAPHGLATAPAALSCYTTALHDYRAALGDPLVLDEGDVVLRAADNDGDVAFSHHAWWGDVAGGRLEYRSADASAEVGPAVLEEVNRHGCAVVVVNTDLVPWSVTPGAMPHWLLVRDLGGSVLEVVDSFAALLPAGEQHPYRGPIGIDDLVTLMRLPAELPSWVRRRDQYALGGSGVDIPEGAHRWLALADHPGSAAPPVPAGWTGTTTETLTLLADVLPDSPEVMARHVEDLWAASRHRIATLALHGDDTALSEAWTALPRSLRFCVDSAARGRPRPAVARHSLEHLASLEHHHRDHTRVKETS